jgi:hypothetical protein
MTTLDKVIDLQTQGYSDEQIAKQLQTEEGISPKEVQDAINQAKVKSAVSQPQQNTTLTPEPQYQESPPVQQEEQPVQQFYNPNQYQEDYYQETPQAYDSEQQYYAPQEGTTSTETISEIAEQVANDKIEKFKKETGDIVTFKNQTSDKISNMEDRLKRIELTMDKFQSAIIGKIGEFGESNALVHKDLENLHGTVSKLMNPLVDNIQELKKANSKK